MLSSLCLSLGWINAASLPPPPPPPHLHTPSKDSLRGLRPSSHSKGHVGAEEAEESEPEHMNEGGALQERDVARESGGGEEVRSEESNGRRSGGDEGGQSEDAEPESREVEKEEQTTGSDSVSEEGGRSPPSEEEEAAKEKHDCEGSSGSVGEEEEKEEEREGEGGEQEETREQGGEDGEGDSETGGAEFDQDSDPPDPQSEGRESGQGAGEVKRSRRGKTLERGGQKVPGKTMAVRNKPPPSAEVGLGLATPLPPPSSVHVAPRIQLHYLRGCLTVWGSRGQGVTVTAIAGWPGAVVALQVLITPLCRSLVSSTRSGLSLGLSGLGILDPDGSRTDWIKQTD